MINKEQKQQIQKAIEFCCDEIEKSGEYEEHPFDSQITSDNIEKRAIEKLTDDIRRFRVTRHHLNDSDLIEQEKEVVNYIRMSYE